MSVRKAHNSGRNHLRNVVEYYQRMSPFLNTPDLNQSLPNNANKLSRDRSREGSISH
jgi:hypothetical protein